MNPITIPSAILIGGQPLRSPQVKALHGTITGSEASNSVRWVIAEQTGYQGLRDMWNPRCYLNAGKVSDREYFCGTFDSGGVHENSSVPNHAYTLLVDGGTYNGQTISPIGLTKAAHIYFRAMTFYQTPTSDFADHAEALEAAASDLISANLPDLTTGLPSGQSISLFDLDQVHNATLAVELRTPPTQCGFQPLLAKNPPQDTCPAAQNAQIDIFKDDHYVSVETGFDGGQLLISVNDGPFQLVDPRSFIYNPYNMRLFPADAGFEVEANPRAGQPAFSGNDGGSVNGSWGTSIVDLTAYAHAGDRIRFRWDLSTDYCSPGNFGWYLDNVRVYSCHP